MKNIGVICEYNPFHNGHAKQLRQMNAAGISICLMSGNYVQRGEPAIIDKYTRARAAVMCGANLVLELPLTYAISSAEGFADGGLEVFSRLGSVNSLCFGSENGDLEKLMSTAKRLNEDIFSEKLKKELKKGVSFPKARQLALGEEASVLEKPNDILAVEYCKAILKRGNTIEAMVLRREGDYHGGTEHENPSATFLRTVENWSGYMPTEAWEIFREAPRYTMQAGERAWLARLRGMTDGEFEALPYGSEGLWRKVMHACRRESTLEAILAAAKSKRYPRTRLMRLLLCAFLGISEETLKKPAPYVRILATDAKGQTALRQMRKGSELPLIHAGEVPPDREYAELERRANDLYALLRADSIASAGEETRARIFRKTGTQYIELFQEKSEKNTCNL